MLKYYGADPEFSLEGKTAVITGGAAGIRNTTHLRKVRLPVQTSRPFRIK